MEKGCNTRLDEAQYNKNSSKAPFIQQSLDGNKRAAVLSEFIFPEGDGIEEFSDPNELETVTLQVAAGEVGKDTLTRWIWNHVVGKK